MRGRLGTRAAGALVTFCLLLIGVNAAPAQRRGVLPRVGAIRDDQTVGATKPGCGNHILYRTRYAAGDIFRSDDDGANAWMNLDGRNVRLELLKTTLRRRDPYEASARYEYRYRNVRVTVSLTQLSDYTVWLPATLTVRAGRAARTIKAFIAPQCD